MNRYLVTFDLHGTAQPVGSLYASIYNDIRQKFGDEDYCKELLQFCVIRSVKFAYEVKADVREIIEDKKMNYFSSYELVVVKLAGPEIGEPKKHRISCAHDLPRSPKLKALRKFFVGDQDEEE